MPGAVMEAETGPWWRGRVTALQAGWLTLAVPAARVSAGTVTPTGCPTLAAAAAMAAWSMPTGLRLMALVNRMAQQRCRQDAARLLRLKHRTLAASAGDSGNVVMGVAVGDNVGASVRKDDGGKVLGDAVVGAGGGVRRQSGQFLFNFCLFLVRWMSTMWAGQLQNPCGGPAGAGYYSRCLAFPAFPLPRNLGA